MGWGGVNASFINGFLIGFLGSYLGDFAGVSIYG